MPSIGNERGGRRPNSGAKPGRNHAGRLLAPQPPGNARQDPAASDSSHALAALPAWMQSAIRLSARGKPYTQIAIELGRHEESISAYVKGHPEAVKEAVDELVGLPAKQAFAPLAPATFAAYSEVLADPQHKDRLAAARDVADRLYDKARVTVEHTGTQPPIIMVFDARPPAAADTEPAPESRSSVVYDPDQDHDGAS